MRRRGDAGRLAVRHVVHGDRARGVDRVHVHGAGARRGRQRVRGVAGADGDHVRRRRPGPSGPCRVTYRPNAWNNGFTADVTVTNTGTSTVNGWTLTYALPAGQTVTSAWNAVVTRERVGGDRAEHVVQRDDRAGRQHVVRLPGNARRHVRVADGVRAERHGLHRGLSRFACGGALPQSVASPYASVSHARTWSSTSDGPVSLMTL